ncbi:MAG: FHA domain-containing protein [Gammaproteobacteria bacterium]|jgi:hypothetical protein|nr:FHA domain-containing protein [Gammaproteobacteria bacterium]
MAGKLILSFNDQTVGEFPLDKEAVTIGRRPECDIHIDNLAVSGRHARVMTIAGSSFLEDLESTNGTFVNGKKVAKHPLSNGDLIMIGKHALRFSMEAAAKKKGGVDFAETIVIGADQTSALRQAATDADAARARQADEESRDPGHGGPASANIGPARVRLISDAGPGKEMSLSKALTTLGRPGIQVAAISRRHNGDFIVHVDGGPDNERRPIINGTPIGVKSQLLRDQDIIEIAGVKLQYLVG